MKQPWADQIARGEKTAEERSWSTTYRGDLLITAASSPRSQGPHSCAICVVELVDVVWAGWTYEWVLAHPRRVRAIEAKGLLKLWTPPAELVRALGLQVR